VRADGLRPEVAKHEALFVGYVKQYGAATVRKVLDKGNDGHIKLTVMRNKKDRWQMIQLLGI
jgi:hypothetical protein